MSYTALVTISDVENGFPAFANLSTNEQNALISAATMAVNRETDRILGSATWDQIYRPGRRRTIHLKQYPVTLISRVCADLGTIATIQYTNTLTATRASIAYTFTGPADNLSVTGLAITSNEAGVATVNNFLFSTYTQVGPLCTAINAIPNWTATVQGGISTDPNFNLWATTDLNPDIGNIDAYTAPASLTAFTRDLQFTMDYLQAYRGDFELFESFADGYRYPDRMRGNYYGGLASYSGVNPKIGGVRVLYTAGYATADVPFDLKQACIEAIVFFKDRQLAPGAFKSKSIGQVSYVTADPIPTPLPAWICAMLDPYRRCELA